MSTGYVIEPWEMRDDEQELSDVEYARMTMEAEEFEYWVQQQGDAALVEAYIGKEYVEWNDDMFGFIYDRDYMDALEMDNLNERYNG
jgi:hypothetical protein